MSSDSETEEDLRDMVSNLAGQIDEAKRIEKLATIKSDREIKKLKRHLAIATAALIKIRDEDYRGTRHSAHFIAKKALEETL